MNITFNPATGHHSFVGTNGKTYSSVNKSYIESVHARMYGNKGAMSDSSEVVSPTFEIVDDVRTDAEISEDIRFRFETLDMMVRATLDGNNRAMVVSGPAGLGKTTGVMRALESSDAKFTVIKGHVTPFQLYQLFWKNRRQNNIIVFDDSDGIFEKETSLNLLKAACDSSDKRIVSWLTTGEPKVDSEGEFIPDTFEFEGSIIFITNKNFNREIERGSKYSPHFEALRSRSHYVSLGIETKREYIIHISNILATRNDLSEGVRSDILQFIKKHQETIIELSLRVVNKLVNLINIDPKNWERRAEVMILVR